MPLKAMSRKLSDDGLYFKVFFQEAAATGMPIGVEVLFRFSYFCLDPQTSWSRRSRPQAAR